MWVENHIIEEVSWGVLGNQPKNLIWFLLAWGNSPRQLTYFSSDLYIQKCPLKAQLSVLHAPSLTVCPNDLQDVILQMFLQHSSTQVHISLPYISDICMIESPPGAQELLLCGIGHPWLRSLDILYQHLNAAHPFLPSAQIWVDIKFQIAFSGYSSEQSGKKKHWHVLQAVCWSVFSTPLAPNPH